MPLPGAYYCCPKLRKQICLSFELPAVPKTKSLRWSTYFALFSLAKNTRLPCFSKNLTNITKSGNFFLAVNFFLLFCYFVFMTCSNASESGLGSGGGGLVPFLFVFFSAYGPTPNNASLRHKVKRRTLPSVFVSFDMIWPEYVIGVGSTSHSSKNQNVFGWGLRAKMTSCVWLDLYIWD